MRFCASLRASKITCLPGHALEESFTFFQTSHTDRIISVPKTTQTQRHASMRTGIISTMADLCPPSYVVNRHLSPKASIETFCLRASWQSARAGNAETLSLRSSCPGVRASSSSVRSFCMPVANRVIAGNSTTACARPLAIRKYITQRAHMSLRY